jgi:hypothetical protein
VPIVNQPITEDFTVIDHNNNYSPVTGLTISDFSIFLFDGSNNAIDPVDVGLNVTGLGSGHYRLSFIPDSIGNWLLSIRNTLYFPWGKAASINVEEESLSSMLKRILGLVQENYTLDMCSYNKNGCLTQARMRVYEDAVSVGTDNNIIAEYEVTGTYDSKGKLTTYKVIKL